MKIVVAVTEVAELSDEFEIDGLTIPDAYFDYSLNEWDDYAVEEAVQLSEEGIADEVVTVTIGPERAEETVREALAKGADRAIRVWDDEIGAQDVLLPDAKATMLAAVVEEEDPDLVLTGVQTDDGGWGTTGVALARELGVAWAAVVTQLDLDPADDTARVHRELEGGTEEITDVQLPAVMTIQSGINEPRYASLRGIRQARQKELTVQSFEDLDLEPAVLESETEMLELYEPESESETVIWEGDTDETATELAEFLRTEEVIDA